ncbi:uncharacterized protein LOC128444411 isoform X1 [Pleuronectes platessa]|uniref:uncharacterized protein LOC128444411 isoform X1 n=1 Tax=Pleuronectes platessa TaxID=8262 RepID=UPI00232A0C07|nr:uncharacterized protein LOC128444411 isoform X1 [Pleuronectes platessa]
MVIMDKLELLSSIFSVCKTIYGMAENIKTNKERCQRVAKRVKSLEEMVLSIKQRGPGQMSSAVVKALNDLWISLISTKELIMKYSQTKAFMSFLKSNRHEEQFNKMNESLTDNFQVLSGVLQVEHGNMLCKVYDSVSSMQHNEELPLTSPTCLMPCPMPTAPMPLTMPLAHPTPIMHLPMPVLQPTTPTHNFAGPRPGFITTAPMPRQCITPCMQIYSPKNPMSFSGTMAPIPLSPTFIPQCGPAAMFSFNGSMAPMPLIRPFAIMTVSPQIHPM